MWLYWCLLSTIISGFTSVALKKCSNNEPKRIALMGLLSYHLIMIVVSMITNPEFITKLNVADMINMFPIARERMVRVCLSSWLLHPSASI